MASSTLVSAESRPGVRPLASHPVTVTAGLLALASVLGLVEAALPGIPVAPWLKLGLANIAVVVALAVQGGRTAAVVSVGRVIIVGLAAGTIGSPTFIINAAAAVVSLAVMWALSTAGTLFSPVGWSAAGSAAHMAAQFGVAAGLLGSWAIVSLAPPSIALALPLGAATGHLARSVVSRLRVV